MLTRRIRIQITLFVVIAVLGVTYVGFDYVGLNRYVHDTGYTTTLDLPEAGGLFQNAEVTYRGVPVGRVSSLDLTATGVRATLRINGDAPRIPADVTAVVADRSVIGEQYVDLRPSSDSGPYLQAGSRLTAGDDALPPDVDVLLRDSRDFAASVPLGDLRTVVDEVYAATRGAAEPLRQLLASSGDLVRTADANLPATQQLIDNSSTVLATQERSAGSIRSFSRSLKLLSGTLKSSDRDFRALLAEAPDAAVQFQTLFVRVGQPLGVVMSNLISTAQVFGTNATGLREVLVQLPLAIDAGYAVTSSGKLKVDAVTNFYNPLPCIAGYQATPLRSGLDTTAGQPLSTTVGCAAAQSGTAAVAGGSGGSGGSGAVQVTSPTELAQLLGGS